jgi:hypothetical protein
MGSRHVLALGAVVLLALPVAAGAVTASGGVEAPALGGGTHGDHVSVDAQAVSDGTVLVETVSAAGPSFVVLWTDDGGYPGEPVGHASVPAASFRTNVAVRLADETWSGWSGNRTLRVVLHRDDGDGSFDPDDDPSMASRNPAAESSVTLGRTDGDADRVLARVFGAQRLREGTLTVRRVDLSRPGYVVATSVDGDRVVGTRALDAGTHRNVTLALNDSVLADQRRDFRVRLVAYRDDGDGTFDAGDRPVRVGDERVATSLVVRQRVTTGTGTPTTTRPLVITPTPGGGAVTSAATAPTATPTSVPGEDSSPTGSSGPSSSPTSASGPGFGVLAVLLGTAVAVAVLTGRRRNWRE